MEEHPGRVVVPRGDSGGYGGGQMPPGGPPSQTARRPQPPNRRFGLAGISAIVVVLIIAVVGGLAIAKVGPFATRSVWSAVFLGDNEVFFGHLSGVSGNEIDLTNVYYLQKTSSNTSTSGSQSTQQPSSLSITGLVANQIQCPKDFLSINRNAVLYWQDLQDSSFVVSQLNKLTGQTQKCFQPSAASPTPTASSSASPTPAPSATPAASPSATP